MREVVICILLCVLIPATAYTQMYTQMLTNAVQTSGDADETPVVKEPRKSYIKGLLGKDSLSIGRITLASMVVPGYSQAYNRQYWKIPVIYGAGAALIYGGRYSKSLYNQTGKEKYKAQSNYYYAGAGLVYLGGLIDGIASYKIHKEGINPTKATLFSTFLPGLGQAYNGDYWKIPVIYAGFAFTGYWFNINNMQYIRFRKAYNAEVAFSKGESETPSEFNGRLSEQSLKNYRNNFRRNRDFAVLWIAVCHAVNIIDATVFAHLSSFDVSEDLALNLSPAMISPTNLFSQRNDILVFGLNLKINIK